MMNSNSTNLTATSVSVTDSIFNITTTTLLLPTSPPSTTETPDTTTFPVSNYYNTTSFSTTASPTFTLGTASTTTTTTTDTTESLTETSPISVTVTEAVHKFQRKIWTQDGYGNYIPYEDQYTTPYSILLLNFFLVIFLMIVIGVAVYPAVRKYCDSTFCLSGRGHRYWIEDNEEVVSVLTSSIPECSFALLNHNTKMAENADDSSSACSLEALVPRSELT